jgi:hypothetical protein
MAREIYRSPERSSQIPTLAKSAFKTVLFLLESWVDGALLVLLFA